MRQWYELWAKAGAGPNFRIDNVNEYLIYFNWIPNWIDKYFFNKVSDFLLGIIFISFIFYFAFKSKIIITDKKKYNITSVYIIIIIIWLEWVINNHAREMRARDVGWSTAEPDPWNHWNEGIFCAAGPGFWGRCQRIHNKTWSGKSW